MLRIERQESISTRHLEVGETETRGHRATDQGIEARTPDRGPEPTTCLDDGLKAFPRLGTAAQLNRGILTRRIDDMDGQGRAVVEVPDLILLEAVQRGEVGPFQEEV